MEGLGIPHLLIIGFLLLVLFGPSKLPQFGQSLGKAIRGFKQGLNEIEVEAKDVKDQPVQSNEQLNQQTQNQSSTSQPSTAAKEKSEIHRKS